MRKRIAIKKDLVCTVTIAAEGKPVLKLLDPPKEKPAYTLSTPTEPAPNVGAEYHGRPAITLNEYEHSIKFLASYYGNSNLLL